jgi:hypothetical protein
MPTLTGSPVMSPNQPFMLPMPTGQTPLSAPPQWGGAGGGAQAAAVYAYQDFMNQFGRAPSQQELAQFAPYYMGADPNIANVAGGNQAISSYFNQQNQIAQAPQQEAQQIQAQIPIISNLVNQQTQATAQDLTNPNSPTYQSFAGLMNNMGITPSSGAFQAGLGGVLGQNAAQATNAALGSVGLPIASGYSQGSMAPFQQAMQQPQEQFTNNLQMQDMLQQMMAASQIAQQGAPSGLQNALGMASGSAQGAGSLLQGGAQAYKATWICTAMVKAGVMDTFELQNIHYHLFKAFWKRPFKFLKYLLFGRCLVYLAAKHNTDWRVWKPEFYDRVMAEPDPAKAVDLYEEAFWNLYRNIARFRRTVLS